MFTVNWISISLMWFWMWAIERAQMRARSTDIEHMTVTTVYLHHCKRVECAPWSCVEFEKEKNKTNESNVLIFLSSLGQVVHAKIRSLLFIAQSILKKHVAQWYYYASLSFSLSSFTLHSSNVGSPILVRFRCVVWTMYERRSILLVRNQIWPVNFAMFQCLFLLPSFQHGIQCICFSYAKNSLCK